jgi:hypothetical protein
MPVTVGIPGRGALARTPHHPYALARTPYRPPGRVFDYTYGSRLLYELDHYSIEWDLDDCLSIGTKHLVYLITNTSDCHCDWCYETIELNKQKYTCSTQATCDFDICTYCYHHAHEDLFHVIH